MDRLDHESAAGRPELILAQRCKLARPPSGPDMSLRRVAMMPKCAPEVERRLKEFAVGDISDGDPVISTMSSDELATAEDHGRIIGPYKLLQQIGEGGMGVVFIAQQTQPIRREVALKIIKPGMGSRHVIARFEASARPSR